MVKSINLTNFRNFKKKTIDFSEKLTVIVGPNATGKTNILEALYLLSTGRSFKAQIEEEMVNYNAEIARISGRITNNELSITDEMTETHYTKYIIHNSSLEAILTRGTGDWPRKRLLINGVPKRLVDFAGNFKVVLFGPWDLDLVTESPGLRRRFLDMVLSQVDREYRRVSLSYEKGLRQRNRLLFRIREEGLPRSQLLFWNQLLIRNGNYITQKREDFIEFINNLKKCNLKYDSSAISEERLEQYGEEEIAAATTLVGPHRDDFIFLQEKRDLSKYGSRGQQRMEILWLKLAELAFVEKVTQTVPTLLLDDIFSELDHEHRDVVLSVIVNQQTIITTADEHFLPKLKTNNLKLISL